MWDDERMSSTRGNSIFRCRMHLQFLLLSFIFDTPWQIWNYCWFKSVFGWGILKFFVKKLKVKSRAWISNQLSFCYKNLRLMLIIVQHKTWLRSSCQTPEWGVSEWRREVRGDIWRHVPSIEDHWPGSGLPLTHWARGPAGHIQRGHKICF